MADGIELAKAYVQIIPSAKGIKGSLTSALDQPAQAAGKAAGNSIASGIKSSIGTVGKGFESFILVDENINKEQLVTRFQKTLEKEEGYARMSENKLNGNFAKHAPENLIQEERDRLAESQRKIETLKGYLKELM